MRRFCLASLAFLVSILCHETTWADAYAVRDNRGHVTIMNEGDADSASGVVNTFLKHDWDLAITFGARAANNSSGAEERAIAALTGMGYLGSNLGLGLRIARPDLADANTIEFAPTAKLYVARDPNASWTKGLKVTPFSYTLATGSTETLEGGAWSFAPEADGFIEFPLGFGAAEISAGVTRVVTQLSEDVPDETVFDAGFTFVWWWVR